MQLNGIENQKHLLGSCWPLKTMSWFADLCISIILTEEMGGMLGEQRRKFWRGMQQALRERSKVCKASVLLLCQILTMHSQRTGGGGGVTSSQQLSGLPRPEALTSRLTE